MFISKRCGCRSKACSCYQYNKAIKKLCKDLSLLSVKSRLDILFLLKDKPHCVCDLISHTNMSQSLISHHLSDLTDANLVTNKRQGKYIDYYLTNKGKKLLQALLLIIGKKKSLFPYKI